MRGNAEAISLDGNLTVRESIIKESGIQNGTVYNPHYSNGNGTTQATREKLTRFYILSRKTYYGKRVLDIMLALIGMIPFVLVYPIIALGIKLSSRGPVIYKQIRTGQNGYPFTCFKFRTMECFKKRLEGDEPDITQRGDPRIFGFGKLLRRLNLDELPQLINVLKGDMSLVGPRPYDIKECAYWNNNFSDHFYRYAVKPGISGLAQVNGYRGGTLNEDHMRKRLDYDLIYVEKCSIKIDLRIILRTVLQMIHLDTKAH